MGENKTPKDETPKIKVGWVGYAAFIFAIIIFSGIFSSSDSWLKVFDFNVLNGKFGTIPPGAERLWTSVVLAVQVPAMASCSPLSSFQPSSWLSVSSMSLMASAACVQHRSS